MKIHEGKLSGIGKKFAVVVSRFNNLVSDRLVEGAEDCLLRHGVKEDDIEIFKVPGAYEIPYIAKTLAEKGKFDALICLGAIIRGETPHFDFVSSNVMRGIMQINLEHDVPVVMGIITADTLEQALDRAGAKQANRGFSAAMAALELTNLENVL
ncbi:6,7-dimethyl-8-ribityllumazine synthase [candidate division WOR-3 bacterium JGI_Cruoil_03_44_89]|uniref:6,7-dimethyl-8-ribityllumazine synthase n=1 Tax=candidate division WOR-3 bacterium JGI_Cruoil_03_44_89 TaxID=1973748 RepID=A0A235BR59_UNCW3|nr:MAG: 6,7-dimethyl-8-ribityllumazine synthase [candidate division WOR-3 bacterium JGI_Cruoil_03_44_89]